MGGKGTDAEEGDEGIEVIVTGLGKKSEKVSKGDVLSILATDGKGERRRKEERSQYEEKQRKWNKS